MTAPRLFPDTLTESAHPVWRRSDWFRAFLFGTLGVVYAVIMFPLAVAALIFWVLGLALGKRTGDNDGLVR